MSNCPYCKAEGCYNSGFKVECTNNNCRFFTQKQYDIHYAERTKSIQAAMMASGYKVDPGGEKSVQDGRERDMMYSAGYKVDVGKDITVTLPPGPGITHTFTLKKNKNPDLDRGKDGYFDSHNFKDVIDKIVKQHYGPKAP